MQLNLNPAEALQKLQEPFSPTEIEWRVGATTGDKSKGIALAYVTNRAIQSRLDEVFGPFGWKNEYKEWKNNSQLCGISVFYNGEWITKWDGADDSETEAIKGGLSDSMKRAAVQWGIGRYLYNLENEWVPLELAGKSYKLAKTPRLPKWALPAGFQYDNNPNLTGWKEAVKDPEEKLAAAAKRGTATDRQLGAIRKKSPELGITDQQLKVILRDKFQAKTIEELDITQASQLIGSMRELAEAYKLKAG